MPQDPRQRDGCRFTAQNITAAQEKNPFAKISDIVYELLTQMFENQESMAATQAKFQFLTLENAVAGVGDVPMHPGAEKFYTEKGVL